MLLLSPCQRSRKQGQVRAIRKGGAGSRGGMQHTPRQEAAILPREPMPSALAPVKQPSGVGEGNHSPSWAKGTSPSFVHDVFIGLWMGVDTFN